MVKLKMGEIPDNQFVPKQLEIGIRIEREHSENLNIRKQIAKAHLVENPLYYDYLLKMEEDMENNLEQDIIKAKKIMKR